MKKVLLSAILMVSTLFCAAQKGNFGIVNYVVPADYQLIKNDNVLTYYKEDKSTGAYCNFLYIIQCRDTEVRNRILILAG
ncbi:hypothetical protein [Pedobacter steynii]